MIKAVAVFKTDTVKGVINFEQQVSGGLTTINIDITGVPVGAHGFHIHEFGDLSQGCVSAGAHFNPFGKSHGDINDSEKHIGDLGNLVANSSGIIKTTLVSDISLIGKYSVIGRSIMLHADIDDLGRSSHELSKTTGNSGARIACAVIGIAKS